MKRKPKPMNDRPLEDGLKALIAHWNSEGRRCYHMAHERRNGNPDQSIMAQAVRFWECARELEECMSGAGFCSNE